MNVIVVPDAAMIVVPLIEKNGHTYLSPSNFSKYNNTHICDGDLKIDDLNDKYISSELPSGVKSRIYLFSNVINKADAAIVLGKRPGNHNKMYNYLNDLILFGSNSCNNARSLELEIIEDLNIPTLKLIYPQTKSQIIELIHQTNYFLKNLDNFNNHNLGVDLTPKMEKYSLSSFKKILDNLI